MDQQQLITLGALGKILPSVKISHCEQVFLFILFDHPGRSM